MNKTHLMMAALLVTSFSLGACSKKNDAGSTPDKTEKTPEKTPEATPPKEAPKAFNPQRDAEVTAGLKSVVDNCDTKFTWGRKCKAEEQKKFGELLRKKRLDALDTLIAVSLDTKQDAKIRQLAAYSLDYYMTSPLNDVKKGKYKITEATADALIKGVQTEAPTRENGIARYFIKSAVHTNNLLKRYDKVKALIDGVDAKKGSDYQTIKSKGIANVMTYGRMAQFDLVKKYADSDNSRMQRAAFRAPRNMYKHTDDEDQKICPWAEKYLSKDDKATDAGPARILLRCKDRAKYSVMLVEEAKKRGKAGTFGRPFVFAFRELCSRGFFGMGTKTDDATCARVRKLLLVAANSKKLDDSNRALALGSIAYQWRNEESLKLMKKYLKHPNEKLAKTAKREIEMLTKSIKRRKEFEKKKKAMKSKIKN